MASPGRAIINKAFEELKSSVSIADARTFENTKLQDVWDLAREIEREQSARLCLRNIRRIEPILKSFESYASVIDVFCQGFSPMAWVWGPIKLFLTLSRQYVNVIDTILGAYKDIADQLPRLDKLRSCFGDDDGFQGVLSLIYRDLAEFHQRAYKFFRRRAWHVWFAFDWGLFERRFKGLLNSLAVRFDLVDKEAAAIHFLEMKKAREADRIKDESDERQRELSMYQQVRTWLSAQEDQQEERLGRLSDVRQPGTCNWILAQASVEAWVEPNTHTPLVWLTGIPGAGKTMLSSLIIQHLEFRKDTTCLYFFFESNSICAEILRTIAVQLLQQNLDLASLVHQAYLQKGSTRSSFAMKKILKELLGSVKAVHVILDGVDECEVAVQQEVLVAVTEIRKAAGEHVKLLVLSRDESQIAKILKPKIHVSLKGHTDDAMTLFVDRNIDDLREDFPNMDSPLLTHIRDFLLTRAKGMFLWVKLVSKMLRQQATEFGMEKAVQQLPEGLDAVYDRILERLRGLDTPLRERALLTLYWACTALRAVRVAEVAEAIMLRPNHPATLDKRTRLQNPQRDLLDLCAPIIERSSSGRLEIVHFSAKEYLLDSKSGPFVDIAKAHFSVAFSCLSSLNASLIVVPRLAESTSREDIERLMIAGNFGIFGYAHDFWTEHVEAYLGNVEPPGKDCEISDSTTLVDILGSFCRVRRDHPVLQTQKPADASISGLPRGLQKLAEFPALVALILDWIDFRKQLAEVELHTDAFDDRLNWQLQKDKTWLSLISSQLLKTQETLLSMVTSNLPGHIDKNELALFKSRLGDQLFACRYSTCAEVFSFLEAREQHEQSHNASFPCLHCDLTGRGFKSRRALNLHIKQYHSSSDIVIPSNLRHILRPQATETGSRRAVGAESTGLSGPEKSGQWNDKGRKALQTSLKRVHHALISHQSARTLMNKDPDMETSNLPVRDLDLPEASAIDLEQIGRKIDNNQYQRLRYFEDDVESFSRSSKRQKVSCGPTEIQQLCTTELERALQTFPDFASIDAHGRSSDTVRNLGGSGSLNMPKHWGTFESTIKDLHLAKQSITWSTSEIAAMPRLFAQYGRNFHKIADYLKTKTAKEIEVHFDDLISEGRDDIEVMVAEAEARLDADRQILELQKLQSLPPTQTSSDRGEGVASIRITSPSSVPSKQPVIGRPESRADLHEIGPLAAAASIDVGAEPHLSSSGPELIDSARKPKRRAPVQVICLLCPESLAEQRRTFRDEYTLEKHVLRLHSALRKVWVCSDASINRVFLSDCDSCLSGKRYGARHNAADHLKIAHFNLRTSMDTLRRWMTEIEEPNPSYRNPESRPQILPATTPDLLDSDDDPAHLLQSPLGSESAGRSDRPESVHGMKLPSISSFSASDHQFPDLPTSDVQGSNVGGLPLLDVSFDDILQGYGASRLSSASQSNVYAGPVPHLAHRGYIRIDHVDRLPHLPAHRTAATKDQVQVLYDILNNTALDDERYHQALMSLGTLTKRLLDDLRDWRRTITYAPPQFDVLL